MDGTDMIEILGSDDLKEIMRLTGQADSAPKERVGLPRLGINYDQETNEGEPLTRGDWKIMVDGRTLYAKEVTIQPLMRRFEYSVWDSEMNDGRGGFASKSVQTHDLRASFPDSTGGNKCGRLSRDEEESLDEGDPRVLLSRSVVCNQVIYGKISGDFKDETGNPVQLAEEPFVAYFKKSGFKPISDFIQSLSDQDKLMCQCRVLLRTHKNKRGSVVYWTPVPTLEGTVPLDGEDKNLMMKFEETIKGHNDMIMKQHTEASKRQLADEDYDLAADLKDADAA